VCVYVCVCVCACVCVRVSMCCVCVFLPVCVCTCVPFSSIRIPASVVVLPVVDSQVVICSQDLICRRERQLEAVSKRTINVEDHRSAFAWEWSAVITHLISHIYIYTDTYTLIYTYTMHIVCTPHTVIFTYVHIHMYTYTHTQCTLTARQCVNAALHRQWVAIFSRIDKITGLFCKRAL